MREDADPAAVTAADETAYIFTPDKLPSQRQLFYQLCDLKDDSLQAIVHNNNGRETTCTVRRRLALLHGCCVLISDLKQKKCKQKFHVDLNLPFILSLCCTCVLNRGWIHVYILSLADLHMQCTYFM